MISSPTHAAKDFIVEKIYIIMLSYEQSIDRLLVIIKKLQKARESTYAQSIDHFSQFFLSQSLVSPKLNCKLVNSFDMQSLEFLTWSLFHLNYSNFNQLKFC